MLVPISPQHININRRYVKFYFQYMPRAQCDAIVRTRLPSVCDIQYNICIFIEMMFSESNWKIEISNGKYGVMKLVRTDV